MIATMIARYLASMIIAYVLGSIPSGLILAKKMADVDVREWGSGKIGATNVLRSAGRRVAILSGLLDILKGAAAVLLAGLIIGKTYVAIGSFGFGPLLGQVLAGLAAVVGHNWSIFLKFRGGSGVATFFGGWIALFPMVAIFGGEILFIGAASTLFMSLGSIAGVVGTYAIVVPLTIVSGLPIEYLIYALVGTGMIIYTHRGNIKRLLAGKERKLTEKAERNVLPPEQAKGT
ncbi:MAG: glycerol-3-phosphate 1-O-acyltransferase PlsY [Dehalococcoidales bacterium]|nr:glycerol-3-phosphate 1-O-acyltransferase PlsY [Dehalococcoidales bacterium]